jgi:hypothetical protein
MRANKNESIIHCPHTAARALFKCLN